MKRQLLLSAIAMTVAMAQAQSDLITLDLTKSTTPLEFNDENGSWVDTYDDDAESIDSQVFSFVHSAMAEWKTWWGFTASNSADNARPEDTLTHQWSNMGVGGIVLNEDGTIKKNEFGAPVTSAEVPYLVAFYSSYMSARPVDMSFVDGQSYIAEGVYVNLNSYAYYSIEDGDSFARAFTDGDKFTLTIHGVAPDETEKTVEVSLASYTNGDLTINRGWKYVDLSDLGLVNEIYFTLESTDSGVYGMNTPGYFCLDKLMVTPNPNSSVQSVSAEEANIAYERTSHTVSLTNAEFAIVYDMAGNKVMTADSKKFSVAGLAPGVYMVKAANKALKIIK